MSSPKMISPNTTFPNKLASICIAVAFALSAPQFLFGQYTINTIAGGGPNHIAALSASTGYPESIAFDSAGNAYIAESYASQILEVSVAGTVTVVAGNGTEGYSGDGGLATSAALDQPEGVFVDSSGNIFIADTENSVIREVLASTGNIQTVVGVSYDASNGSACQSGGDGGPALSANLCVPYSVFVDGSGNIFIADFGNSTIREVVASTGNIQTVAGTPGTPGYIDGVLATSAELDLPASVVLDAAGNIIIADTFNSVIRVVNPGAQPVTIAGTSIPAGFITTVAGSQYDPESSVCQLTGDGGPALTAFLCLPFGVFVDSSENIFVADYANFAIREVASAGTISTVAGTLGADCQTYATTKCGDGAAATSAQLNYPSGVTLNSGNIFIADTNDFEVREVTGGNIQAFAGNATQAYSGDGGLPTNAELNNPGTVFVDASGNVFIADTNNSVIREIVASTGDIATVAGNGVAGYSGDTGLATSAELNFPQGVFLDSPGDIFIADSANNVIREVVASTGKIQTVVGNGTAGFVDNVAPLSAELDNPFAVAVDISGNIFIADNANDVIRVVNTGTTALTFGPISVPANTILTVAGTPQLACGEDTTSTLCGDGNVANTANTVYLSSPAGVVVDATDNIFIADTFDNAVREVSVSTGIIQTVAGTIGATGGFSGDGGAATSALLDSPFGVFLDASNDIFIADSGNAAIREVVTATGFIQTIAGIPATNGFPTPGFSGDGGPATSAELDAPSGVFVTSAGKVFIADTDNSRIRELAPAPLTVTVAPSTATVVVSALQQYTATVTGNANTGVNWFVNGAAGGNSTVGTISTTGVFQAPAAVPSPATVTISAISQVDDTTTGTAQATIANPSVTITVTVSTNPPVTQVYTGTVQPFTATVTGTTNTAVTWYVEGAQGGDATFGTIDTSGNYTAPASVPSPATVTIEAVSQADATAIGVAQVTIVAAPAASQPAPQTVSPGGTANYSLSLNARTGSPSQPITLSCLPSSLPAGATCVFSQNGQTITIITPSNNSVPFALAVTVPSASASLQKAGRPWIAPQLFAVFFPLAGILLLGAKSRKQRVRSMLLAFIGVLLLTLMACGGGGSSPGSTTYTIKIQGTTAAQPNPVTITTASLTVQ
jgi:trimeric autotransporter adhesin